MLVLGRRPGEVINIGEDIKIMVINVSGDQVRLGIEAPKAIPVHREEVYNKIKEAEKNG